MPPTSVGSASPGAGRAAFPADGDHDRPLLGQPAVGDLEARSDGQDTGLVQRLQVPIDDRVQIVRIRRHRVSPLP